MSWLVGYFELWLRISWARGTYLAGNKARLFDDSGEVHARVAHFEERALEWLERLLGR